MTAAMEGSPLDRNEVAGRWCVRLTSENFGPEEQAEFDHWLSIDPGNAEAFDRSLRVWQELHAIARSPEVISMRAGALESLRRANERKWSQQIPKSWPGLSLVAAGVAVVLLATTIILRDRTSSYETQIGEQRAVLLKDGSRLSLDAATEVAVDYGRYRRTLELVAGRAKFDVAQDISRPFVVKAGHKTITAIGTAFSVELLDDQVQVILYEGRVAVTDETTGASAISADREILDHPGGRLIVGLAESSMRVDHADLVRSLAWESGQLNFADEPLQLAVQRLNRHSTETIVIDDETIADIPIDGVFNAGDSAAFVEAVASAFPIAVRKEHGQTVLSRNRE